MGSAFAILFVFIGCCSNVVFLELLVKEEPASGNLITFCQFLFIAVMGFVFTMQMGTAKNMIPVKEYLTLVIFFFIVNVCNNVAFGFKISMPLHMIFRSGGLIANLVMAMVVLGRRYTVSKYLSVVLITFGTVMCTFASADQVKDDEASDEENSQNFITWIMGIALLTFALFMSARMGIYQECLYKKHGKHAREALFFIHLLSLPGFLLSARDIMSFAATFSESASLPALATVPVISAIPKLWFYVICNTLTQYVCISSVFMLTSQVSSLTVTLVLTLRKFVSLMFSIIYFGNAFTLMHWMGTALVFGGTLIFTNVIVMPWERETEKQLQKDKKLQ
uniref:UDP-xylose and UDP-N-acetylglucosamine transporter-like n=1 Tax=Hirondellea gigas TaxID=1518452 RepID=A0A2P2I068_9CRUS